MPGSRLRGQIASVIGGVSFGLGGGYVGNVMDWPQMINGAISGLRWFFLFLFRAARSVRPYVSAALLLTACFLGISWLSAATIKSPFFSHSQRLPCGCIFLFENGRIRRSPIRSPPHCSSCSPHSRSAFRSDVADLPLTRTLRRSLGRIAWNDPHRLEISQVPYTVHRPMFV